MKAKEDLCGDGRPHLWIPLLDKPMARCAFCTATLTGHDATALKHQHRRQRLQQDLQERSRTDTTGNRQQP